MDGYQHNLDKLTDPDKYIRDSNGEIRYIETGKEKEISIEAGKSRDYTEFFKEYHPNPLPKEKRKHEYTVSIHPAVFTQEAWNLYKRFKKFTFGKVKIFQTFF